jgi:hypothetical protein
MRPSRVDAAEDRCVGRAVTLIVYTSLVYLLIWLYMYVRFAASARNVIKRSNNAIGVQKVCERHAPERELTAHPDLRRLTRRAQLAAELLP